MIGEGCFRNIESLCSIGVSVTVRVNEHYGNSLVGINPHERTLEVDIDDRVGCSGVFDKNVNATPTTAEPAPCSLANPILGNRQG